MKTHQHTDDKLVRGFNRGEAEALTKVYDMYFNALYFFAYRIIEDTAEAEDIAAVTLEALIQKHAEFETMANIKAFLYISVRNKCLNYIRASQYKRQTHKEIMESEPALENYVLIEMVRSELMNEIYQEIESLPPTRRSVIKLFLEGLSTEEICQRLNMKPETVWFNKSKALQQLRNVLLNKKLLSLVTGLINLSTFRWIVESPGMKS